MTWFSVILWGLTWSCSWSVCSSWWLLNSVQFSHSVVSDSLWPHESQHTRPPCPSPTPRVYPNLCPSSGDVIQPSHPLSSPSPSAPNPSQHQGLFQWVSSSHQVAKVLAVPASASVLPMSNQDWPPLGWTGWISLQSNGLSRVFSIPQFKSINSLVLSFLHSPTLTSIHDHWKNHSLDQIDLCCNVSAF